MDAAAAYRELEDRFRRISALGEAAGMLHWDAAVAMPPGGAPARAEQLAALARAGHDLKAAPRTAALLDAAEEAPPEDPWAAANLREMRRGWLRADAIDGRLAEARARAAAACEAAWRLARADDDFAAVAPLLAEVLARETEAAAAMAGRLGGTPYEALLDGYEPGLREDRIAALFDDLLSFLPGLLDAALARQAARDAGVRPPGPFPADRQEALARRLMAALGFDFSRGRLDASLHPFCGGGPGDVRVTTRYDEDEPFGSLMGVLHETGHALYEAGLPERWRLQPVGRARGMVLHESQSLLVEMQVCRGPEFLAFAAPAMREAFGGGGAAWSPGNLGRLLARVRPGLIRVDADEATYPAHVALRWRLERLLVAGELRVAEIPGAWGDGMAELLGVRPPDDRSGCLQDIHWYDGAWGYFPLYTLGALAAAQLFAAARDALPGLPGDLARGAFAPLAGWLRENVHAKASSRSTEEVMLEATGRPLGTEAFKAHLETRYG